MVDHVKKLVGAGLIAIAVTLAAVGFMESARADTLSLTCTAPTQRADGTALTAAEIKGYNWYVNGGTTGTFTTACSVSLTNLFGTGTVKASTVDTANTEGALSASHPFTLGKAAPKPPVILP